MNSEHFDPEELRIAEKILDFSRRRITMAAPLLLTAVCALRQRPKPEPEPLSTDGTNVWFCPARVIEDFRRRRDEPAAQLLHVTLHCLLDHVKKRPGLEDLPFFDVLADWKVDSFAAEAAGSALRGRVHAALVREHSRYGRALRERSLPELYRRREGWQDVDARETLSRLAKPLQVDDHGEWSRDRRKGREDGAGGGKKDAGKDGEKNGGKSGEKDGGKDDAGSDWDSIRQELCARAQGELAGWLRAEFAPAAENGVSYAAFLKRFASPQERLLTDPDSFDARWYHLGLALYGDMPLIEPSELSEPPLPDDLVIALDTSGSCSGDVCRRFLRETLNLLRDITAGVSSFHILLLQCDAQLQRELLLESPEQIDSLSEDFKPRGFGGTDFRPVFDRIAELRENGELPRMRGLLYLSDAYGHFPDKAPDYPTAFLIPAEGKNPRVPPVPDWVIKVLLDTNSYMVKEEC